MLGVHANISNTGYMQSSVLSMHINHSPSELLLPAPLCLLLVCLLLVCLLLACLLPACLLLTCLLLT